MKPDTFMELGLPHGNATIKEEQDVFTSKLGGRPTWLVKENAHVYKCSLCNNVMYLILQMDCPWSGSEKTLDRIIYMFGCNSRMCAMKPEGWKVFIQQKPVNVDGQDNASSSFFDNDYPVYFPPKKLQIVEEIISFFEKKEAKGENIDCKYNIEKETPEESCENFSLIGIDKEFGKFQKRTSYYPSQCVRYCPMGDPLPFNSKGMPPSLSSCSICQKMRCFELQLMPAVLSLMPMENNLYLKHLKEKSSNPFVSNGMEWGTVMVYSCGTCQGENTFHIDCHVNIQIED